VERSATLRSPAARCTGCALIGAACGGLCRLRSAPVAAGRLQTPRPRFLQRRRGRVSPDADHCRRARRSLVRRLTEAARRTLRAAPSTGAHHVSTAHQRFHQRSCGGAGRVACGSRATTGQAPVPLVPGQRRPGRLSGRHRQPGRPAGAKAGRWVIARGQRVLRISTHLASGPESALVSAASPIRSTRWALRASRAGGPCVLPGRALDGPELDLRLLVDHRERLVRQRVGLNTSSPRRSRRSSARSLSSWPRSPRSCFQSPASDP
jgi:hypothetical protein